MKSLSSPRVKLASAYDLRGGAGKAAYRLLRGLRALDVDAELITQVKSSADDDVYGPRSLAGRVAGRLLPYLDPLPKLMYRQRHRGAWSCGTLVNPWFPYGRLKNADIVHLHWITAGFLPIKGLSRITQPIVWTFHDSWPFTGGCHIPFECRKYEKGCCACPQLGSTREDDLSSRTWQTKSRAWGGVCPTVVAPSRWMASCVAKSKLFCDCRIEIIPNGLDTRCYSPADKSKVRRLLGLPIDAKLILFSAMGGGRNWNKGSDLLAEALRVEGERFPRGGRAFLLLTGCEEPPREGFYPLPVINFGQLSEEAKIRDLYCAADLTVVPSRSESLSYVAMESMSCGTPVVAFSVGGIPDLIEHESNGFLAEPDNVRSFAAGMRWIVDEVSRSGQLADRARNRVAARYDQAVIAGKHLDLYAQLINDAAVSRK